MPEITYCMASQCTKRNECLRYRAIPDANDLNSYFDPSVEGECPGCEYFIDIRGWKHVKLKEKNEIN